MEYLVNYTTGSIRIINGVTAETIAGYVLSQGWSLDDNYNILVVETNEDALYKHIIELIDELLFEVLEDEHPDFLFAQEMLSTEYDDLPSPGYNHTTEVMWGEMENELDD